MGTKSRLLTRAQVVERLQAHAACGRSGERWTEAKILAALRARHASGKPLNTSAIKRDPPRLLAAAGNHFGSMPRALAAARLPLPDGY